MSSVLVSAFGVLCRRCEWGALRRRRRESWTARGLSIARGLNVVRGRPPAQAFAPPSIDLAKSEYFSQKYIQSAYFDRGLTCFFISGLFHRFGTGVGGWHGGGAALYGNCLLMGFSTFRELLVHWFVMRGKLAQIKDNIDFGWSSFRCFLIWFCLVSNDWNLGRDSIIFLHCFSTLLEICLYHFPQNHIFLPFRELESQYL